MPFRVLIVDLTDASRPELERVLIEAGHYVTSVTGFHEAKQRLMLVQPDILVTGLKLGAYNGIQLVLRVNAEGAGIPAIVVNDAYDPVLEREAVNAGAVFRTLPLDATSFVTLVEQLLREFRPGGAPPVPRRWPRKHTGMVVDAGGSEATLVDVSYGGLRLEFSGSPGETPTHIARVDVPNVGMVVVHPVWARGDIEGLGRWWCGVEVDPANEHMAHAWRQFVDSLA